MTKDADRLFGLPLAEFTKERDALVRALRGEGRRDEAAEVAALRKPVLAAWVVNQLARHRRAEVRELLRAAGAVKSGRRDADERFRSAADALGRSARALLADDGQRASDAVLRDVATTLRAAAASDPDLLAAGRLTQPLEATGFEAMAGVAVGPPRRKAAAKKNDTAAARARVESARKEVADARAEVRRLEREATAAETGARNARAAADEAGERLADAERELEGLKER